MLLHEHAPILGRSRNGLGFLKPLGQLPCRFSHWTCAISGESSTHVCEVYILHNSCTALLRCSLSFLQRSPETSHLGIPKQ